MWMCSLHHHYHSLTGEQVHTYNSLPFKGPVTCVAYHPFNHVVAMCGLGGRTVSVVCFTDQMPTAEVSSDNVSSPRSGSGALVSAGPAPPATPAATTTTTTTLMTRRKLLQKSMTVDSQSTVATDRYASGNIASRKSKQSSPSRKFDPQHDMSSNTPPAAATGTTAVPSSSGTGSRMRRAMKRLEIALLMKSFDRS